MPGPPSASFGDGHDGPVSFETPVSVINVCHPLVSGSSGTVSLASGDVLAGTTILVWQVQDAVTVVSSAMQIAVGDAGNFDVVRVSSSIATELAVDPPLARSYSSGGARRAQVCTIPEYQAVTLAPASSLEAPDWDGSSGGFLGFLANGTVTIDGTLSAKGAGFRGVDPLGDGGGADETALVNGVTSAGAIGEGIDASLIGLAGRGNAANGGGGGGAFNSGGGGGGNEGAGGRGASQAENEATNPNTFGHGGAALTDATGRLLFGGGGGSGHQNDELAGGGGDGGGVIRVLAWRLTGSGVFDASGIDGDASDTNGAFSDGAGGGGAGGTVVLESEDWQYEGQIRAIGGDGGSVARPGRRGLAGGGGGGRATVPLAADPPDLVGGFAGLNQDSSHLDAMPGSPDPATQ